MAWFVEYLVSSRFLMVSLVVIFSLVTSTLASSHREDYTIYHTVSRQVCNVNSRNGQKCSNDCYYKECYCQYTTQYSQESVTATRCQRGWGPEPDCNDFDECRYGTHGCAHTCTNTHGSYICSCNVGYRLASDGRACNDIDECQERTSNCSQICYNTVGSYSCNCNTRYSLASNGRTCNDIDECKASATGCNHSCSNTIGSYKCICKAGYRLAADGRSCSDIDECAVRLDNCTELEHFTCENTIGSYQCVCKSGFEKLGQRECRDINECETLTNNCTVLENLICENSIGSYKCQRDSIWTNLLTSVTVGVGVGIIFIIIAVVYFLRRAKKRNRKAEESIQRQASPDTDYAEVDDVSKKNTDKQEQRSTTAALCSAPEGKQDLQNKEAAKDSKYQDLVTVREMKQVYEAIRNPLKSGDSSVKDEASLDSSTHTKEKKELQTKEVPKDSKYQDLVAVMEMKQVYEAIRNPLKSSDISVQEEKKDVKIGKAASDSSYQELSVKADVKCVYESIKK